MAKKSKKKRETKMEDIPMTPMIDIVFQLLVYFVYTFNIQNIDTHIQVSRPAPSKEPPKKDMQLHKIVVTHEGEYFMNGARMSIENLETVLQAIADTDDSQTVTVHCVNKSVHEDLVVLLNICSKIGLENIAIVSM